MKNEEVSVLEKILNWSAKELELEERREKMSWHENGFDLREIVKELKNEAKKRGMDCEKSK